ncbi:MAG: hypothetical protein IJ422_00755 [Oscillospiraceae bacterium]|nr:hypothetical protein [Oscillospiraceae bacterium]MBQ9148527.1 hypothetical protein [Oscillospiraceae bacterium]
MNKKFLLTLWGGMFILCAGLGFIPTVTGFVEVLLVALALGFFIPPALLLRLCQRKKDRRTIALIRNLSFFSLVLTTVLMVANILSSLASELVGDLLNAVLVIVSSPMACSQNGFLTIFCWACLMIVSHSMLKKKKNRT